MKLHKIFRSNRGFSMVEISVAMGLLGIATLAVVNLTENVNTSTRRAEVMLSKSQFASALGGYMYSSLACNEVKAMTGFGSSPTPIILNDWKVAGLNDGDMMKNIGAGKKFKNFNLKALNGTMDVASAGLTTVTIGGVAHVKTFLNVNAVLEVTNPVKRDYEYFFNIPVLARKTGSTGKVAFCNEEKTIQETCASMKGVYNPVTKQCDLEKTCLMQGTFNTLTCTPAGQTCSTSGGTPANNPLTNSKSCPTGSNQIQTGLKTWSHIGTCSGKKCTKPTVYDTMVYYSCLKCPGMTAPSSAPSTPSTSGGGGGGGGCFVAGTQIHMFGGDLKSIEDVKVGDELVDHSGTPVIVQSLKAYNYKGEIYSINGGGYFFTPNHPFLTTDGWKSLDPANSMKESPGLVVTKLKVGDLLLKRQGFEKIKTLDSKSVQEKVYNFTVTGSHEYIADDYAVHNLLKAPSTMTPY